MCPSKIASEPLPPLSLTPDEQQFLNFLALLKEKMKALRNEANPLSYWHIK